MKTNNKTLKLIIKSPNGKRIISFCFKKAVTTGNKSNLRLYPIHTKPTVLVKEWNVQNEDLRKLITNTNNHDIAKLNKYLCTKVSSLSQNTKTGCSAL